MSSPRIDFTERLRPHGATLARFVRHQVAREADAADVLQTALTRAFELHSRYDPESSFKAWIFRIVANEALNHNRRARSEAVPVGEPDVEVEVETELAYDAILADPDAALAALDDVLVDALAELPGRERAAFLLRTIAELACGEVAELMGVPKGTVLSWLFRVRQKLRRSLSAYARAVNWRTEAR